MYEFTILGIYVCNLPRLILSNDNMLTLFVLGAFKPRHGITAHKELDSIYTSRSLGLYLPLKSPSNLQVLFERDHSMGPFFGRRSKNTDVSNVWHVWYIILMDLPFKGLLHFGTLGVRYHDLCLGSPLQKIMMKPKKNSCGKKCSVSTCSMYGIFSYIDAIHLSQM